MSKHTSGPWKAEENHEGNILICTQDGMRVVAFIPVKHEPANNHPDNARLIAAAPSLLDACKRVLDILLNPPMTYDEGFIEAVYLLKREIENAERGEVGDK